jgi:putative addiction module component (TIGR02574 family)
MTPELRAAVFALPADERRKLAEELLESVDEDDLPPLTDAQFEEPERRRLDHEANPGLARPWDEVYARLKARYGG